MLESYFFASFIISDIIPEGKLLKEDYICFRVIRMGLLGEFRTFLRKDKRQQVCNNNVSFCVGHNFQVYLAVCLLANFTCLKFDLGGRSRCCVNLLAIYLFFYY